MALKVGELVAFIRADSTQFDQAVDQSGKRFEGLRSAIGSGVKTMATAFAGMVTVTAGLGVAAFRVGKDFNVLQQNSRAALETILGGAEEAAAQMDRLNKFADTSPFARQVWITAQQQLLGFGVEAKRVVPILDAIQQSVAAVGGGNEQIQQVTFALATMQGQGKLTGETLNQLGQYGIDAATIIGEKMGKTGQEIRALASKPGGIPVDQVWDPLVTGLMERFDGATEGLRKQWDGAVDRVKAAWRDIGAILAEPFIDPMGGGRAVTWANLLADAMRAFQAQLGPTVETLVRRLSPALARVDDLLIQVGKSIKGWDVSQLNNQLDRLTNYAPLIAGTSTALFALGTRNLPILSQLGITGINPVVAGIGALVAASPELRAALREFFDALRPLVPVAQEFGAAAANTAMAVLRELTPALRDLLLASAPIITAFAHGLAPALTAVMQAAVPLADAIAGVVSWISGLPTPLLGAVAAFVLLRTTVSRLSDPLIRAGEAMVRFGQQAQVQAALGNTNIAIGAMATASMRARGAVQAVGTAMRAAFLSNPVGIALAGLTAALATFAIKQQEARQRVDEYKESLDQVTGAVTQQTREVAYNNLVQSGAIDKAKELGISLRDLVTAAIDPSSDAYARLSAMGQRANDELARAREVFRGNHAAIKSVADANKDLYHVLRQVGIVQSDVADSQAELRDAQAAGVGTTDDYTSAIDRQTDALRNVADAQRKASGEVLSAREAQRRYLEAVEAATESIKEHGKTLDTTTEAGRRNERALDDIAKSGWDLIESMRANGASQEELQGVMKKTREDFVDLAAKILGSQRKAEALADELGLLPEHVSVKVDVKTEAAMRAMRNLYAMWDGKSITTYHRLLNSPAGELAARRRADGGLDEAGRRVARVPMMGGPAYGRTNVLWGEPETGWEAYISGKPSMRHRNIAILDEAARRLGRITLPANTRTFADGGMAGIGQAPAPSLAGLQIEGTLDLGGGLVGTIQGVVRNELDEVGRRRYAGQGAR